MDQSKKILKREDIIATLKKHKDILNKYKVKKIGIFGSFVRDEQEEKSDIDFFVEFEDPSFENFIGLSFFLENLFGKKVEILTPPGIESIRIDHVKEEIKRSIVYV